MTEKDYIKEKALLLGELVDLRKEVKALRRLVHKNAIAQDSMTSTNIRLKAENTRLHELLAAAVSDMQHIADEIDNTSKSIGMLDDEYISDYNLGRCDICTHPCEETEDGCRFQWKYADEATEIMKNIH